MNESATPLAATTVISLLEQFQDCVRYLNTRRPKSGIINLENEKDVQDVIFLMLRPTILDLVPENPTQKISSRYVIKDFLAKSASLVIEAKFIRDQKHGKEISKEIHDDIEMYRNHAHCSDIIFFIYDRCALIPDTRALKQQVQGVRNYDGKQIEVHCIIKP